MAGFLAPADDVALAQQGGGGARTAFGDYVLGNAPMGPRQAQDFGDALISGIQRSATGLAVRGKQEDVTLGAESPWYHRLGAAGAEMVTDTPLSIAGAVAGAVVGTGVAPGAGTGIGAITGAFAAPMALRDALIEAYSGNHALSWSGAWEIAKAAALGGGKGAVLGAATMGAGAVAGKLLVGTASPLARSAAIAGSELTALTATASALEGRMPTWQDFMDNALLLGGTKLAAATAKGMYHAYAETGRTPEQIVADATNNPALKAALTKGGPDLPPEYAALSLEQKLKAAILDSLDADPRPKVILDALKADASSGSITNTPKLNGDILTDPVKYEYIADSATAQGVLRAVTEVYQREITQQTRGEVPNKQTAAEGLKMVTDGVIGEHVIGKAGSAAEIYARAHMLKGATNHAISELQKIASVPEAELTPQAKLTALAAIERVAMLKAEMEGVGAEAGRALQILRAVKRDPALLGEADFLIKTAERKMPLGELARLAMSAKDPAQLAELARQYTKATTMEKFIEGQKAFWLSGPQTHLANLLGNTTKWAVEVPESVLSASIEAARRAVKGDPLTMAQFKARALSPLIGLQLGVKDALIVAGEVLKQEGTHLEKADVYRTAIEGKAGTIIRLPFRALQAEDALFRTPAERAKAYEMAVDRAVKEGLHPDVAEYRQKIIEYTNRPESGLGEKAGQKALEAVQQAGAEAVFAQRLGPRMETLQRAMAGHWTSLVIPFVRTPANLVSWAVQHTPGMNFLSARWRDDFMAGGERQSRAIARVTIGTGLAITAFQLAGDGMLTGGGLFDKEEGGTKRGDGWQPYSLKIGEKYYSIQRVEPVAKVLMTAADLVEMIQASNDKQDRAKMGLMLVAIFGNATVSTTYLSGLSNVIQSVSDPARYGSNFLEQYATGVVPKVIGQTVTMADPYKREVDGVVDAIQSQLPFLREKLLPKRDVWGQPMANDRWFAVMPVATSKESQDKVKSEAVRLHIAIADAPKFITESGPFKPGDKRIDLTGEQRDIFKQVSGGRALEILSPIVNAPDWDRIPDFAKAKIYQDVLKDTRKLGELTALPTDSAERNAMRQKIIDRVIQQTQQVN